MGNRLLSACVAAGALCVGAVSGVHAAEAGFYFGIGGGTGSADLSKSDLDDVYQSALIADDYDVLAFDSQLDDSEASWGAQIGYQWNAYFAAEIGYVDLGKAIYEADFTVRDLLPPGGTGMGSVRTRFRSTGPTVAVLGMLPLGEKFDLHGRAGILFARTRITEQGRDFATGEVLGSQDIRGNSKDLFAGIGGAWNINPNYTLRLDYQRYLDVGDDEDSLEADVDQLTLSILFR
jgi:hypothetical protein